MKKMLTENQAREEICRVGLSLFQRGYVHATAGNISIRLDESCGGGFLITPTDACLGWLDPARLARLDDNLQQLSGDPASKTIALHCAIYRAASHFDAHTSCIVHSHSSACVALSLQAGLLELLPALTPYFVMKVGHVPLIPYARPGDPKTAQQAAQTILRYGQQQKPIRSVMLERLGPNVWNDTPTAAMATLEELEETARLWLNSQPKPSPLSDPQIDELRQAFGARW